MAKKFFGQVKLNNVSAKGSYGIGLQIGQQLLESGLNVTAEAVGKGIFDVLSQNAPAIDIEEVSKALQTLHQEADKARQALFKQIESEGKAYLEKNKKNKDVVETESGLQYEILTKGKGKIPSREDSVRVHYTGKLIDGKVFDSSVERGQPAEFPVTGVIAGWVEALGMMPVGSKWKLTIPHHLAYGERGAGPSIPPFATLVFEVELLDIL